MFSSFKHTVSSVLHGKPVKTVANVFYLQPNKTLNGKKIVITGGSRGLGFAMAKKFTDEGAEVLISGRNEQSLQDSAKVIGCKYLMLDVSKPSTFEKFIKEAAKQLNGINCLVNNAGISLHEDEFINVNSEQFDIQFATNLRGPFFLTQCFINHCKNYTSEETKKILFTSSEAGITADLRPYGLTKAALNSLIQGLAYRYVNDRFRINAVAPGVTLSDMVGNTNANNITYPGNITGRYYLPEEVAEIASFLLSDVSNCLNGQILYCNEGNTINARWK